MSDKMIWFPWYPSDFLSSLSVQSMSATQRGIYISLLSWSWMNSDNPCHLPNEENELRPLCGWVPEDEWEKSFSRVKRHFEVTEDNLWLFNKKLLGIFNDSTDLFLKKQERTRAAREARSKTQEEVEADNDSKPPRTFSPEVENLFSVGSKLFKDAGHKTPATAREIAQAKDVIRLMIERDAIDPKHLERVLHWVSLDTGNGKGWPGWRSIIQSFSGLRSNWAKIWPQANNSEASKPLSIAPDSPRYKKPQTYKGRPLPGAMIAAAHKETDDDPFE